MKAILLAILIVPGLLAAYFILARPLLKKIPAFAKFYDEADGFWAKLWALSGKSLTMLWGYGLAAVGGSLQLLDMLAAALGDPSLDLKTQVVQALKDNPSLAAYVLMGISAITIAARFRGLLSSKG